MKASALLLGSALHLLFCSAVGPLSIAGAQAPGVTPLVQDVERAIEAGTRYLRQSLAREGLGPVTRGYPLGSRALVAYALLESGIETDDPLVRRLFQEMATEEFVQVYGVSLYVLALRSWKHQAVPVRVEQSGHTGVAGELLPGGQSVNSEIERAVEWLIAARYRGAGTWGYGKVPREKDPWVDFSNTQFAVLALHVGVLEGIQVPAAVFEEVIGIFSTNALAGPNSVSITVDRAPWLEVSGREEDSIGGPRAEVQLEGRPISWGYRPIDPRRRRIGSAGWGTLSMTSAAVSSLIVAEAGLSARKVEKRRLTSAVDQLVTGGVIELSRAWRPLVERLPGSMYRNIYYTLYSFEKAMDLAGVSVLDGVDWYRAQVPELITAQDESGAWGTYYDGDGGEYRRMATCFALLFLRRATASLTVFEAAPIITHGEGGSAGIASGRVLVPSLGGQIVLDDLFRRLEGESSRELLGIAAEVVQSVAPDERPELLRWLIPLRGEGAGPRVRTFARETAATITGLPQASPGATLDEWLTRWRRLHEISRSPVPADSEAVSEFAGWLVDRDLGTPLRVEVTVVLRRLGALEAVSALLGVLDDPDPKLRGAGYRAARDLTLGDLPFSPDGEAVQRTAQASAWRFWWDTHGDELRLTRRFEALRQRLERAEDPDERASLRAELVTLGPTIVSKIDRILAGGSYPFDWLLIRQALTGEAGVR